MVLWCSGIPLEMMFQQIDAEDIERWLHRLLPGAAGSLPFRLSARGCGFVSDGSPQTLEGTRAQTRGVGRLSRRRYSCSEGRRGFGNESGVSQTRYRSDFKANLGSLRRKRKERPPWGSTG